MAQPRAVSTTRRGGLSRGPFASLNLGERSGDERSLVADNRRRMVSGLNLPGEPEWLYQVHGCRVVRAPMERAGHVPPRADAAWTDAVGVVCAVLTADCLPVAIAERSGACVAVVHAGWRGLAAGVLEATVDALPASPPRLRAWLGPAIGPAAFAVGDEVRDAFVNQEPADALGFRRAPDGGWRANLFLLARRRLARLGVAEVTGEPRCTWSQPGRFFSHRRDGPQTGRMATAAWLAPTR